MCAQQAPPRQAGRAGPPTHDAKGAASELAAGCTGCTSRGTDAPHRVHRVVRGSRPANKLAREYGRSTSSRRKRNVVVLGLAVGIKGIAMVRHGGRRVRSLPPAAAAAAAAGLLRPLSRTAAHRWSNQYSRQNRAAVWRSGFNARRRRPPGWVWRCVAEWEADYPQVGLPLLRPQRQPSTIQPGMQWARSTHGQWFRVPEEEEEGESKACPWRGTSAPGRR